MSKTKQKENTIPLSEGKLNQLRELVEKINDIKYDIENLSGQENIGSIMFSLGSIYQELNKLEDDFGEVLDPLELPEEEDEE